MTQVLLLDNNFTPLNLISLKKAMKLIVKQKVEVVKHADEHIHASVLLPKVLRLLHSISHIYKRQIPWNKGNIFTRDHYVCQYCGKKLNPRTATVDHVLPKSRGGSNSWVNTVTSCYTCNNGKGDKTPDEAGLKLRRQPKNPTLFDFIQAKMAGLDFDLNSVWE